MKLNKQIQAFFFIVLMAAFASCTEQRTSEKEANAQQISYADLSPVDFNQKISALAGIVLDVRTPEEVAEGMIKNALSIDFYDADFGTKIRQLDKNEPVFVYCKAGGRSSQAAQLLIDAGFEEVYNLEGGITAWQESGFSVNN